MDLIVTHPFLHQTGGGERVVLEISKRFNPVIYTFLYEPGRTFPEFRDFDIRLLPKSSLSRPFFFLKGDPRRFNAIGAGFSYFQAKLKDDYDVINAHGSPSEWIRNRNPRVCWYVHSPNREAYDLREWRMAQLGFPKRAMNTAFVEIFKLAEGRVVPKIERICTNSEVTNDRIKKYLGRDDAKVISPGVDPKEFSCISYDKFFLYPSRFIPEKRFEMAIEAFRAFSKNKKGWKLVLAGFLHNTRRELDHLEKLKQLSSGLNVEFITNPSPEQLSRLYGTCYATLFAAMNEDWGLVPLESMASSKPCISINEGGPRYSILDGETGYLVNNKEEMTQRMLELSNDGDLAERLGKNARKHVLGKYTWKIFLDALEKELKATGARS